MSVMTDDMNVASSSDEQFILILTGPAKSGHICTNYTCLVNGTFLGHH